MTPPRAEPIFFGPDDRPLFGWLHASASSPLATIGLVICNPFGYEAVCAHRSIRHFAMAAANAGIPALRFDYDGTGDSAGNDFDPDRLQSWIRSIHDAIELLKTKAGVQHVCLLGVRLGVTLAALASSGRSDIAGLAAIAPVVHARAYMRELRALALAGHNPQLPEWANVIPDLQESAGFVLTATTRAALSGINLLQQPRPASRVLVLDRDDLPPDSAWIEHLKAEGTEVEHLRVPGFTEMMLDSHEAIVPSAMIASTISWLVSLARTYVATTAPAASARFHAASAAQFSVTSANGTLIKVRESALFPDSSQSLFGIVTEPVNPAARNAPLILLLNSGAVHHIGPNRLYVLLARLWAADGATVLRLDLSGLGDSAAHPGQPENDVYTTRAHEDIQTALRYMRTRSVGGDCHAIGLCSGAYHGFKFAAANPGLASVVAINPLTFAWKAGMTLTFPEHRIAADAMRYRKNAFQWASWKKLLSGGVDIPELLQVLLRRTLGVVRNSVRNAARLLHFPMANDLGSELHRLARQNTGMLFVFAEGDPGLDLLRGGGGFVYDQLLRRGSLRIAMVEGADHTFTPHWSRERLISILTAHVQGRHPDRN